MRNEMLLWEVMYLFAWGVILIISLAIPGNLSYKIMGAVIISIPFGVIYVILKCIERRIKKRLKQDGA